MEQNRIEFNLIEENIISSQKWVYSMTLLSNETARKV